MPDGSYQIEIYGLAQPPLYALALSEVPPGPWDFESLLPFVLPYAGVAPALMAGDNWGANDPVGSYNATATFLHPDGHPDPISGSGLVLAWMSDPPVLTSQPVAVTPWTTLPGDKVVIPLYRTIVVPAQGG